MRYEWDRDPDIIEGEYEVIDEWDAGGTHDSWENADIRLDPSPPYVTYTILGLNVAVWLVMSFIGTVFDISLNHQLLYFGAKVNELIAEGEYWRLFTAMFLHVGVMHLLFNSYALYVYGPIVEKLYGKIRFVIIYVLSGLMGSLFSYLFSPNPAAGASGAIFGLMGSLLYFRKRRRNTFQRAFGPGLFIIIGINLLFGFIQPGIDNWGHIGGLIGGFLAANAVGLYRERRLSDKAVVWALIVIIFALGLWIGQRKYGKRVMYIDNGYCVPRYEASFYGEGYMPYDNCPSYIDLRTIAAFRGGNFFDIGR
ncbi:MAG: rhomboid family intramembrane serine protease [Caldicoprobacter oshimai]|uniref:Rhomboid protease GluP n=1 Tax=Caldicoprobacter faecalis TaxID=937334 RepID=A0A1I5X5Y2_9FIRM|nr:rhomboid family intramembrane serine protease [Caldicoprobacter faecalis]PZN11459.1 MAG: rhomboid family intramembrane serine protease [Caldicoprobacter oshimai]SFQ27360.1 rhomboid protease GluP [Caldicoprobacter faecalis]